jgi:glutamate-1-semialdehyde 2,1-aminomutase
MFTIFFGVGAVGEVGAARDSDRQQFARYFHGMLRQGIYLPPAQFEAAFISLAHSDADLERTIAAFNRWAKAETRS